MSVVDLVDPHEFDSVSTKLRSFFKSRGMVEVPVQHRLSILAACEDPSTISTFEYTGEIYPLPQTGQMWLEYELLTGKTNPNGYFCYSTSYRQEVNPKPGRHNLVFPMIEFEIPTDIDGLETFERDLLQHLGYGDASSFASGNYVDVCEQFGVQSLEHEHEERLYDLHGPVFFLKNFPTHTSPFWNMKLKTSDVASKIDVIMNGIETIGSAERSCNADEMKYMFYNISDGMYAKTLFSKFGKQRVEQELNEFLSYDFRTRSGGGIGVTRLIKSMRTQQLL